MRSVNIYAIVTVAIITILFLATSSSPIEEPKTDLPDRFLIVQYKWDSFNSPYCRYQFRIEGFKPLHRETDRLRTLVLIDDCDAYDKGDVLAITKI